MSLLHDGDTHYTLSDGQDHAWITINNVQVYIKRTDEGVVVDLFSKEKPDSESIGSTWASFEECVNNEEEEEQSCDCGNDCAGCECGFCCESECEEDEQDQEEEECDGCARCAFFDDDPDQLED